MLMIAFYLDGEAKSGKTAVGKHIKQVLETKGYKVRLLVAGNFFRTVTWLTLQEQGGNNDDLPLEEVVKKALVSPQLTDEFDDSHLQSNEVDALVSQIGALSMVQRSAVGWRVSAAEKALADGVEVLLYDGRNLRAKLKDWSTKANVGTALELIIYCRAEIAAKRYLSDEGNKSPSEAELKQITEMIATRRDMDRKRKEAAYIETDSPIKLLAGIDNAKDAIAKAYAPDVIDPPRPILFDNSEVPLADGLATVGELTLETVKILEK